MDWSQFDTKGAAEEGAELHLRDPRNDALLFNDEVPVTITLAGEDSDRVRKAERACVDRRLEASARGVAVLTSAQIDADNLEKLVAAVISWTGIDIDGKPDCTPKAAASFFTRFPAFRDQAWTFVRNRGNFPAPPAKT